MTPFAEGIWVDFGPVRIQLQRITAGAIGFILVIDEAARDYGPRS